MIGLFDSGVGGLTVLRAVARELPSLDLVYFADQKYCPYGPRPAAAIRARSGTITRFLLDRGSDAVVVACNTASAAALYDLRDTFPDIPIVGMEPAVKPAARASHSGKIAVLATRGTLQGELFARTRLQYANEVEVFVRYPEDWVARVEHGDVDSPETEASVRRVVEPLLEAGVDEIALGCTHYPFLEPLIRKIAGEGVAVIDPSDAVARQTARVLAERDLPMTAVQPGAQTFYTSGDPAEFSRLLEKLLGKRAPAQSVLATPEFN